MPLTADDKNQLYSEAFARNTKAMLGESAFAALDLMTQRDVATMESGVLRDEVAAVSTERDDLKGKWEGSTEGRDAALQAIADAGARPTPLAAAE